MGKRAAELASFKLRQVGLPNPHGLGGINLGNAGRCPEELQRGAQIPRRSHQVLLTPYRHQPIIACYQQIAISLITDMMVSGVVRIRGRKREDRGMRFVHDTLPQRVSFGSGEAAASLEREVAELGASRVMVIASKREMDTAGTLTGNLRVLLRYDDVVMHVPVEVAARAREAAAKHNVDAIVSIGGGSTTGLAKAIALTTGLPVVAVPTTYAGSEATAVWGLTEGNRKTTGTDPRVLPKVIVYDATLTLTLPVPISVASGLNALAHCVDAM